jgi:hypothetical protein
VQSAQSPSLKAESAEWLSIFLQQNASRRPGALTLFTSNATSSVPIIKPKLFPYAISPLFVAPAFLSFTEDRKMEQQSANAAADPIHSLYQLEATAVFA